MNDVRIPQGSRLDTTQNSDVASRVGATPTTAPTAPRVLQAPSETNAARTQQSAVLTGRGTHELASTPPTTPMSRLTSGTLDNGAAARSFIDNLHALRFEATNDSDAMTSAFLKLEVTNMSTNQDIETYLNQARHYIREAALAVTKADQRAALLGQAAKLERQAAKLIREAMKESGRGSTHMSHALEDLEQANGSHKMTPQAAAQTWRRSYDAAGRAVREAAQAHKAETDALARGDEAAAAQAHKHAKAADSRARTLLEAARIKVSDPKALGELALDMDAAGDHGNPVTRYLDAHPDAAGEALDSGKLSTLHSGQEIVDAIAADRAARAAAASDPQAQTQLGTTTNATSQQALSELQNQVPSNSAAGQKLAAAAGLLRQAQDLRNRAVATASGIAAAEQVVAQGRSDEGEFGVQRRNMMTQDDIMRGLTRLLGGTRADQQSRENANREARDSQVQVVQLMRDMVDRDEASKARRGHIDRI